MNLKPLLMGVALGLAAVWLANNSPTVAKLVKPAGAGNTPALPF